MSKSRYTEEGSCKPNSSTAHGNIGGKRRDIEESSKIEQTKQNNEGGRKLNARNYQSEVLSAH